MFVHSLLGMGLLPMCGVSPQGTEYSCDELSCRSDTCCSLQANFWISFLDAVVFVIHAWHSVRMSSSFVLDIVTVILLADMKMPSHSHSFVGATQFSGESSRPSLEANSMKSVWAWSASCFEGATPTKSSK